MTNLGRVKIGNHYLRSRRIVRPFPADVIRRVELLFRTRTWRYIEFLPAPLWCELIDSLSRCDCGRPVPPIRARSKHQRMAETCSVICLQRRRRREEREAAKAAKAQAEAEREALYALNESLYQAGETA